MKSFEVHVGVVPTRQRPTHNNCINNQNYLQILCARNNHTKCNFPLLLVNILEVLPKDKKAKEEKTAVLGQASLDLLPVLMGETNSSTVTLSLHTVSEGGVAPTGDDSGVVGISVDWLLGHVLACT